MLCVVRQGFRRDTSADLRQSNDCVHILHPGTVYFILLLFRVSAFHEGDSETVSLLVLVDDVTVIDDWTSSGTTLDFQTISLAGFNGQSIQILADSLEDEAFLDITEVRGYAVRRKQALERVVQR